MQPAPIIFQRLGNQSVAVSGIEMRPERAVLQVRLQEEEADPDIQIQDSMLFAPRVDGVVISALMGCSMTRPIKSLQAKQQGTV